MNIDEIMKRREQVSALADGQLGEPEFAAVVELAAADDDARASWHVYHFVGDVLRSGELAACGRNREFVARLRERLRAEPAPPVVAGKLDAVRKDPGRFQSSNDSSFRWKLIAGFASLAAVAAIGWNAIGALPGTSTGERLAQSSTTAPLAVVTAAPGVEADASPAAADLPVMIRDPRLNELLAAHRQSGGISALQNPTGFLRNATFDGTAP